MRRFNFGSLRVKLISLVLITMLPVFGLIIYTGMQERDHIRNMALTHALDLVRDISVSEANTVNGVRKTLFLLSQMMKIHDLPRETIEMVLKLVLEDSPELAGLVVAEPNGDVIADSYQSAKRFNISDLPSFKRLMQTKKFVIGEYQVSRITGKPVLTLRHPVFDNKGRVKKIISAGLDLGRFNRIINNKQFSPNTHLNILDHNGIVLFRHPDRGDLTGKSMPHEDVLKEALTRKEGVMEAVGMDGAARIYGFASFGQPDGAVYVIVGIPKSEVFASVNRTMFYHLVWLLGVTLAAIIIASLLGRVFIFRPLDELLRAAKQIRNGDVTARVGDVSGRGEIVQLIHAFDHMGEALQQREEARAQAVRSLQESEVKLRTIFESSVDAIGVSKSGMQTFMNRAYLSLFGYSSPDELINQPVLMLIAPSEREIIQEHISRHAKGKVSPSQYETRGRRKDETEFDMDVRVSIYELGGETYSLVILRDISERKQSEKDREKMEEERKKLEERLYRAEKMDAIGNLAGGIAHDFNNLLMGIQGYASLMLLDFDASHPDYERLQRIEELVQSGADLTKQLLGFARGGRYDVKPKNMNDIIDKTADLFGRAKKEVTIHRSLSEDLWIVEVDQGQMEQVFMNLYVNAWQAMSGGGEMDLGTENTILDRAQVLPDSVKPGKYVKITVTDTGMGMDAKTRERIFEPFFTTKAMGRGTGLGLAMVYGIIKGHNGMINVDSEPGRGTTFTIHLPASEKEVVKAKAVSEKIFKGTGTILLVDDERVVMEVSRARLEYLGYKVYMAGSGQEAIAVYMEKRNLFDLVILDMIMPGISGGETFDRLREINPEIKVLLASGYSVDGQAQEILNRGCNGFIQKPYQLEKLSNKVREMLE